ncbi:hypothetical protein SEA_EYRE_70 [Gordonia phage Eyre]|uniref:Uncharacterized protein n=1 Tax=Gordonia phage Eyre TaxID=1887646 RepID=A0A1B3B031_9CAUD|nr:hypothetical protein BIZ73_gp70 [Gordonia phage Eyre]AOE44349.1 hypothetical protein SEA_EYRE_70 [Gordonia phage Eyre]
MHLPAIPESLEVDDVTAALRSLGIPTDERLVEAKFTPGSVELTFLRTDGEGPDADALVGTTATAPRTGSSLSYVTTTVAVRRKRADQ